MNNNLHIYIEYNHVFGGIDIWLVENNTVGNMFVAAPVSFIFNEVQEAERTEPTIKLNGRLGKQFLEAMLEAIDKHGIKAKPVSFNEGKLEAQTEHLKDLQKLLDLDKQ